MSELLTNTADVIIIGTGIGGATAGRVLAEAGLKVLFLEKGQRLHNTAVRALNHDLFVPEARLARGLWPALVKASVNGKESAFYAPLGASVGGSSTFYAGTLERPAPHDLHTSEARPHPTGGWPVSFDAFEPYIARAEKLYEISGTDDPLSPPPSRSLLPSKPFGKADARIFAHLKKNGLHPYHLHSARRFEAGQEARVFDAALAGIEPALATGNAELATRAHVTRLIREGSRITGVEARYQGATHLLSAPIVLLAAGALGSPRLCFASADEQFPDGLANSSGLVGRGLMFHINEMFAVWPGVDDDSPSKAVGFRDLLWKDGERFGMVQAMGVNASYGEILHYIRQRLSETRLGRHRLAQELARFPALAASKLLGHAKIYVGLLEDLPYDENRVLPSNGDQILLQYNLSDELLARHKTFRQEIKRAFRGMRHMMLSERPELNFGHPCGTLRFGDNPKNSVLNSWGRSHDLENLYVADASFFPTSMGVNPSLTIAAQALRVAEEIIRVRKK